MDNQLFLWDYNSRDRWCALHQMDGLVVQESNQPRRILLLVWVYTEQCNKSKAQPVCARGAKSSCGLHTFDNHFSFCCCKVCLIWSWLVRGDLAIWLRIPGTKCTRRVEGVPDPLQAANGRNHIPESARNERREGNKVWKEQTNLPFQVYTCSTVEQTLELSFCLCFLSKNKAYTEVYYDITIYTFKQAFVSEKSIS